MTTFGQPGSYLAELDLMIIDKSADNCDETKYSVIFQDPASQDSSHNPSYNFRDENCILKFYGKYPWEGYHPVLYIISDRPDNGIDTMSISLRLKSQYGHHWTIDSIPFTIGNVYLNSLGGGDNLTTMETENGYFIGMNIESKSIDNLLLNAVQQGDTIVLKEVLARGANIDVKNKYHPKWTPLMLAVYNDHIECAELLLEKGGNVNATTKEGTTALMIAAESGRSEMTKLLIEKGADVDAKGVDDETALFFAFDNDQPETAILLIENGADVNAKDDDGWTLLMRAIEEGMFDVVALLIEEGADVNASSDSGHTALIGACNSTQYEIEIIELLIDEGADVNTITSDGNTPLMMAVQQGDIKLVRLLIDKGADVNLKKFENKTALSIAKSIGDEEIIKLLKDSGAEKGK